MPTFLTYPNPFTLLLLLLVPTPSVSTNSSDTPDYPYKACVPANCGRGPNITFPFYIRDRQQSFCGFPGFPIINCSSQGFPLLQLSQNGDQYIVHDIFYDSQTLRVYNAEAARTGQDGCFPEIRNLTDLSTSLIRMADNVTKTYLFASCNDSMSSVGIEIGSGCKWDLAMDEKGENFSQAMNKCGTYVVVRVEGAGTGIGRNLGESLQRGFAMHWTAPKCNRCLTSGGLCGFNVSSYKVMCFCPHGPRRTRCTSPEKSKPKLIIATVVTGVSVFLLTCFLCFLAWHGHRIKNLWFTRNMSKVDMEVAGTSYFGIPIFAYQDLQLATNNFDASKELGDGAHGAVYYGKLGNGREVAVKRLYEHNNRRMDQFINEIKILTCLRHQNLVSLYGCTSRTSKELLLVYEYVPNGTLADHLHGTRASVAPMPWAVRLKIAIETAAALSYLHNSGIIHRDVKSDNILLNNNFSVKVADFGLSRLFPTDATHISTSPQGTLGYVDPEYYQCYRVTNKSDVYSFGVVLIELLSSMPAVDIIRDEVSLATMAINKIKMHTFDEMIEPALGHREDAWVARMTMAVTEMAFRCLQADKDMRPSMDEILDGLREIAESGAEDSIKDVIVGNDGAEDVIKDVIFVENVGAAKSEMDFVPLKSKDFQTSSYSADVA